MRLAIMSLTCPMRTVPAIDIPMPEAQRLNRKKGRQPKGGVIMAILNNGKLINRRYQSDKAAKKEETSILQIGAGLIVTVFAMVGILALTNLMFDQDW